jgi:hypothetical protein
MYHLQLIDLSLAKVVILEHILHINHAIVVFLIHLLIFLSLNRENKVLAYGSRVQTRSLVNHLLAQLNIHTVVHRRLT